MGATPSYIWDPNRPVPAPVIDHFVKMKEHHGLHIHYPFGWMNNIDVELPTLYFDGLTFRTYWFARTGELNSRLTIYEEGHLKDIFVAIENYGSYVYYRVKGGAKSIYWTYTPNYIYQGWYYSYGIQMVQDKTLKIYYNDILLEAADMNRISGRKWRAQILVTENTIFSLQYTDELNTSFPSSGLGSSFWLAGIKLQVGSTANFQGRVLRFEDTDVIEAKFGPPDLKISFKSGSSFKDKQISFILKRTVLSFLLVMDFTTEGAIKSTPTEEPYKSGGIDPVFSDNFCLLNTFVEWGSFTLP